MVDLSLLLMLRHRTSCLSITTTLWPMLTPATAALPKIYHKFMVKRKKSSKEWFNVLASGRYLFYLYRVCTALIDSVEE